MHETGSLEVVVLCAFWSISTICRNCKNRWWKSAITLSLGNVMTSKAQLGVKAWKGNTTVSNLCLIVNLLWFLPKKWVKILIVPSFRLKFDDVTVTLTLTVLSRFFLETHLDTSLLNAKVRYDWLSSSTLPPPPSTLSLSNFRATMVGPIWKFFSWADVQRMSLQEKI